VAYYAEEPWGALRDNVHAGIVASTVVNAANAFGKSRKTVTASDFMLVGKGELEARKSRGNAAFLTALRTMARKKGKK
jgi:hypothetical protein